MTKFLILIAAAGFLSPAASVPPAPGACTLLAKSEVKKLAGSKDQFFDMVPPREEALPGGGSSCAYSGITIQIEPFPPARLEAERKKAGAAWQPVAGIGDAAYIRDNRPSASLHYAELYAVVRGRVFTIQMSVRPPESALEVVRPSLLALAKALAAKLG